MNKDKKHTELALLIFEKAVEWAEPEDRYFWWESGTNVQVPPLRMNQYCMNVVRNGFPGPNVIDLLRATTPGSMKAAVAGAVIAAGVISASVIELVKSFNFRAGLPMLLEAFRSMQPGDGTTIVLMNLMAEWDYREGAQAIVALLDMTIDDHVCGSAVSALKKLEYLAAIPALKLMIPCSAQSKVFIIEGLLREWGAL